MMMCSIGRLRKYMKSGITETTHRANGGRKYRRLYQRCALITIIVVNLVVACASAADSVKTTHSAPPLDAGIDSGRQRFERNCAICHGLDARGNGPFAELLNVKPPDLTLLSRAQGGDFPFSRIYRRIDGRDLPLAHGTRDMPVWGQHLKREGGDETFVRGRLFEIMLYLESLQQI